MGDTEDTTPIELDTKTLHGFIECDACGKNNPPLRCSRCKLTFYCSATCQQTHWSEHKPDCRSVKYMRNLCEGLGGAIIPSKQQEGGDDGAELAAAVNSECGICLQEEMKDPVVLEKCHHAFCFLCLKEWQTYSKRNAQPSLDSSSCPNCRQQITVNLVEECTEKAKLYAARGGEKSLPQEERSKCYDLALQQLDKILSGGKNDRDLASMSLKAQILTHRNPKEAVELYKVLLARDEESASNITKLNVLLDRVQIAMNAEDDDAAERHMDEVEAFQQSLGFVSRIGDPADPVRLVDVKLMLAEAHEASGQWQEALDVYIMLLNQFETPDMASPRQNRSVFSGISRCMYEMKEFEKAVQAGEAAWSMNRHFPGVHQLLARPQQAMGMIQLAVASMSRGVLYEDPWDDLTQVENIEFLQKLQREELHPGDDATLVWNT